MGSVSVLQGEIYVSSMTCLGKNTANIWIHQDMEDGTGEGLTNLGIMDLRNQDGIAPELQHRLNVSDSPIQS